MVISFHTASVWHWQWRVLLIWPTDGTAWSLSGGRGVRVQTRSCGWDRFRPCSVWALLGISFLRLLFLGWSSLDSPGSCAGNLEMGSEEINWLELPCTCLMLQSSSVCTPLSWRLQFLIFLVLCSIFLYLLLPNSSSSTVISCLLIPSCLPTMASPLTSPNERDFLVFPIALQSPTVKFVFFFLLLPLSRVRWACNIKKTENPTPTILPVCEYFLS